MGTPVGVTVGIKVGLGVKDGVGLGVEVGVGVTVGSGQTQTKSMCSLLVKLLAIWTIMTASPPAKEAETPNPE